MQRQRYTESVKQAKIRYQKNCQKRIAINWLKSDYEGHIEPAIARSGLTVSAFFKQAVIEKIQRDGLEIGEDDLSLNKDRTIRAILQKYINDSQKTVLYITEHGTMYTYVKTEGAKYTWEDAIKEYGDREYENISDDAYVVDIVCKET